MTEVAQRKQLFRGGRIRPAELDVKWRVRVDLSDVLGTRSLKDGCGTTGAQPDTCDRGQRVRRRQGKYMSNQTFKQKYEPLSAYIACTHHLI